MDKKKIVIIILSVILLFSFAVIVPFFIQHMRYKNLGVSEKKIVSAEVIVYGGDAFNSNVIAGKVINDEETLNVLNTRLNMKKISLYNPSTGSTVIFLTFDDGSELNCFLSDDKIGFNYGEVWLKIKGLSDILADIL